MRLFEPGSYGADLLIQMSRFTSLAVSFCFFSLSSLLAVGAMPMPRSATVSYQPGEPDWFTVGDRTIGRENFYCVNTQGHANQQDAEQALLAALRDRVLEHLNKHRTQKFQSLESLSSSFIRKNLVVDEHFEIVAYEDDLTREAEQLAGNALQPYYKGYAEIRLTPQVVTTMEQWANHPRLKANLTWIGLSAASVLGVLVILFGFLKADHVTRSHFTRRLQWLTIVALGALAIAIYWLGSLLF